MLYLDIKSGEHDYRVTIGEFDSIQNYLEEIAKQYRNVVIVMDKHVKELYPTILDYKKYNILVIEATEEQKTLGNLSNILDFYQNVNLQKKDTLVAIGGGIIQDIVAFTSKIYYRGIDYYLIPTTLLSMSDSSIGAKCGINYNDRKNQMGVFNSPRGILQNINFIQTLKHDDIISGVGEIVKLLLTSSQDDFNYLKENILDCINGKQLFTEMTYKSLLSKKVVIEEDEYESDLRRILNYGHTFGHAIESLSNYKVAHGIAVLWGIDVVNFIAYKRGFTTQEAYREIHDIILKIYDIKTIKIDNMDKFIAYVKNDKKMDGKEINIVYPETIGNLKIKKIYMDEELIKNLTEYNS